MSRHYLFAINNATIRNTPEADHGNLRELLGKMFTSFNIPDGLLWEPKEYICNDIMQRLAFFDYDDQTAAIRAEGFSFEIANGKDLQAMDREEVKKWAKAPKDSRPPNPQEVIDKVMDGLKRDPMQTALDIASGEKPYNPNVDDIASTIFTVREEIIDQLRSDPELATRYASAVLGASLTATISDGQVGGINWSPAFRKRIIVRQDEPVICFWVFNGLHLVEQLTDQHWRVLEKKKLIRS